MQVYLIEQSFGYGLGSLLFIAGGLVVLGDQSRLKCLTLADLPDPSKV